MKFCKLLGVLDILYIRSFYLLGFNTFLVVESTPKVIAQCDAIEEAKSKLKDISSESLDSRIAAEVDTQRKIIRHPVARLNPKHGFNTFWWNNDDANSMYDSCEEYLTKREGKLHIT